jgi:hypothetical protein
VELAEDPRPTPFAERALRHLVTYRLIEGLGLRREARRRQPVATALAARRDLLFDDPKRMLRIDRYYSRVLGDLKTRLEAWGGRLLLVNLDLNSTRKSGWSESAHAQIRALVERASRTHGIPFADTYELFEDCRSVPNPCLLEGDGHLSEAGHRRLARFVADLIRQESLQLLQAGDTRDAS